MFHNSLFAYNTQCYILLFLQILPIFLSNWKNLYSVSRNKTSSRYRNLQFSTSLGHAGKPVRFKNSLGFRKAQKGVATCGETLPIVPLLPTWIQPCYSEQISTWDQSACRRHSTKDGTIDGKGLLFQDPLEPQPALECLPLTSKYITKTVCFWSAITVILGFSYSSKT